MRFDEKPVSFSPRASPRFALAGAAVAAVAAACGGCAVLAPVFARAESAPDGAQKAAVCAACHGENGISANDLWPNLAGQKAGYLEAQLKAYRSGERQNAIMNGVAGMLSDADVQALAAHFAKLERAK